MKNRYYLLFLVSMLLLLIVINGVHHFNGMHEKTINYNFKNAGTSNILSIEYDDRFMYISIQDNYQLTYGILLENVSVSPVTIKDTKNNIVTNNQAIVGTGYSISIVDKTYKIVVYGDVNSDGIVNKKDYRKITNMVVNKSSAGETILKTCDMNSDGIIKMNDVIALLKRMNIPTNYTPKQYCDKLVSEGKTTIDYKDFTTRFNENYNQDYKPGDDYYGIKFAHECANRYDLPVKVTKGTYNIYKEVANNEIVVQTDTDLNNSTIYIHDEGGLGVKKNGDYVKNDYYDSEIYSIRNKPFNACKQEIDTNGLKYNNVNITPATLNQKYNYLNNGNYFVTIENSSKRIFVGRNSPSYSKSVTDVFRVSDGSRLEPLFWDNDYYDKITKVTICPIQGKRLSFKNASFYTIVDPTKYYTLGIDSYTKFGVAKRGILVERSNTTVDNISHYYVDQNKNSVDTIYYSYRGFFSFSGVANSIFSNSKVQALNFYRAEEIPSSSTYDIDNMKIVNTRINNVIMNDYDGTDEYYDRKNQLSNSKLFGVTGSNYVKDITYDGCVLNRIDTHEGVYNLTVKNSVVGRYGLEQIGFGEMNIENVTAIYTNKLIYLRTDYGSYWRGKVNVKNSSIIPKNDDPVYLIDAWTNFDDDDDLGVAVHNYGYDLNIPNVQVYGFDVKSNTNRFYIFNNYFSYNGRAAIGSDKDGNFEIAKNYIKLDGNGNRLFNIYYPTKNNIQLNNISGDNTQLQTANYYYDFLDSNGCSVNSGC